MILSSAWNTMFLEWNPMFTDYWKVLVLSFSEMRNTIFFWAKEMKERWYLLITENFMFWTFPRWEIRSFFEPKSWWKMVFTNCWKVLVLDFSVIGNTVFFWAIKLMKRLSLLGLFELSMIFQHFGNMAFRAV